MSARVRNRVAARRCVVITMEGDCAGTADLRTRPGELHEEDDRACSRPAYGRHCCTARAWCMLAKRRAMPITSRYRTLISSPSCADALRASGHRVSASPTALPGATAISGNRSTSYGNVCRLVALSTKSWCTALRGSAAGTHDSRPRKRVRKRLVVSTVYIYISDHPYICIPPRLINFT